MPGPLFQPRGGLSPESTICQDTHPRQANGQGKGFRSRPNTPLWQQVELKLLNWFQDGPASAEVGLSNRRDGNHVRRSGCPGRDSRQLVKCPIEPPFFPLLLITTSAHTCQTAGCVLCLGMRQNRHRIANPLRRRTEGTYFPIFLTLPLNSTMRACMSFFPLLTAE